MQDRVRAILSMHLGQLQAKGKIEDLEDFDNLEFVPPAVLLSWPKDL